MSSPIRRRVSGLFAGAAMVAAVSGVLLLLEPHVPMRGMVVLYLLAVLPVAVVWGTWFAVGVSVASTAAFALIFVPPVDLRDGIRLGVFLVVAIVTGELAAQLRRRAQEATRLAQEHLSLRRVAVLVGQSVPAAELFEAVTREVGQFSGADLARMERYESDGTVTRVAGWKVPLGVGTRCAIERDSVAGRVLQMHRPVRSDHSAPDDLGIRSSVGAPIVVSGRLWGVIEASSTGAPFPPNTESQIAAFTEIVAIAIADAEGRDERRRLAREQAALRRVATLVARGTPQREVFAAVTEEVCRLHDLDVTVLLRFEPGRMATYLGVAGWMGADMKVGDTVSLQPCGTLASILETSSQADRVLGEGIKGRIAIPITVEGWDWGALGIGSRGGPIPADVEQRLVDFTELVATAIANADSRAEADQLLEHQASLRHVATLVAREVPPEEIFTAVAGEVSRVIGADASIILRHDPDGATTVLGQNGDHPEHMQVGSRWELEPELAMAEVLRTGRPARRDDYSRTAGTFAEVVRGMGLRSSVAIPIVIQERIWGALGVGTRRERFAADTERRLGNFAELVATAVTNAEGRTRITQLLDEQAALRRVATLVASGPSPTAVCAAVAEEIGRPLGADIAAVSRFEPDGTSVLVAQFGDDTRAVLPGVRWGLLDPVATTAVWRTGRSARADEDQWFSAAEPISGLLRKMGIRSMVASPVVAQGRLWGAVSVATRHAPLPLDTEERLASFTELVAMAIGNAESRAELAASRARIVAAADQTRRRIERDLHDGAQQRLVSLGLQLRLAQGAVPPDLPELQSGIHQVVDRLTDVLDELREMSRGIHPAILSEGGLGPALRTLARRCSVPVELDLHTENRFSEAVEVAAYYVVSEALTNTTKHAEASVAEIAVDEQEGVLRLSIRDDGIGGADPARGSGLIGLRDRVEALGGSIEVRSPPGDGTVVLVVLPVATAQAPSAQPLQGTPAAPVSGPRGR